VKIIVATPQNASCKELKEKPINASRKLKKKSNWDSHTECHGLHGHRVFDLVFSKSSLFEEFNPQGPTLLGVVRARV